MTLASPAALALGALVVSPAFYQAFVTEEMDPATALIRFLIAVPVCGLMLSCLNVLTGAYHRKHLEHQEDERRAEAAAKAEAARAALMEAAENERHAAAAEANNRHAAA